MVRLYIYTVCILAGQTLPVRESGSARPATIWFAQVGGLFIHGVHDSVHEPPQKSVIGYNMWDKRNLQVIRHFRVWTQVLFCKPHPSHMEEVSGHVLWSPLNVYKGA